MEVRPLLVFSLCIALGSAVLNDPCSGPSDCADVEHSICTPEDVCGCEVRFVPTTDGTCEGAVGRACTIDYGASCAIIPYALCTIPSLLTCDCTNGYVMSDDRANCWTPAVGGHCLDEGQCKGLGDASCVSNRCECNAGSIAGPGNRCHIVADGLFAECTNDAQCQGVDPNAECVGNIFGRECLCIAPFVPNALNTACLEIAHQMGDACDVGEQCVDPNSQCLGGACTCKQNFVDSLDQINCLPVVAAGEACVQDQQCPTACVERVCT